MFLRDREKTDCILALEGSTNFASTHMAIKELEKFSGSFDDEEKKTLFAIGAENNQVYCILNDPDVKAFYEKLLNGYTAPDEHAARIKEKLGRK